jgi:hypothetical protein
MTNNIPVKKEGWETEFRKWLHDNPDGNPLFYAVKDNTLGWRDATQLNQCMRELESSIKQFISSLLIEKGLADFQITQEELDKQKQEIVKELEEMPKEISLIVDNNTTSSDPKKSFMYWTEDVLRGYNQAISDAVGKIEEL